MFYREYLRVTVLEDLVMIGLHGLLYFLSAGLPMSDPQIMLKLDRKQRRNCGMYWPLLAELIAPIGGLINELHAKGCITSRQRSVFEALPSHERTKKLLQILSRKSRAEFDSFFGCLPESVQHHFLRVMNNTNGNVKHNCMFIICLQCAVNNLQQLSNIAVSCDRCSVSSPLWANCSPRLFSCWMYSWWKGKLMNAELQHCDAFSDGVQGNRWRTTPERFSVFSLKYMHGTWTVGHSFWIASRSPKTNG